jgi:hypothetical protein
MRDMEDIPGQEGGTCRMRCILRYAREGPVPFDALNADLAEHGVRVVDSSPTMVLVEGSEQAIEGMQKRHPGWVCVRERIIEPPSTRPSIRRPS